jgi:hypothetical protein
MRRFQFPNAALVAGLAVLLSGCSGETPTAPGSVTPPGGVPPGPCSTVISLSASTVNPVTASAVRATVTKAGVPVANGSVQFTTDLGFFGENGLQTISKTIVDGVADVSVFSSFGTAHVIAVFDCAKAQLNLQFSGAPTVGPFVSSISPTTGSCAGGDTITILGGRFTGTIDVTFGGVSGSIVSSTATQIIVKSPARTLRDPAVPETVPLVVSAGGVLSPSVPFTFVGIDPLQKVFITSLSSTGGASAGNDTVTINGGHFGANIATTRVTFCGRPAQITAQVDQQITVTTPASPSALEVCDVVVTRDIGLCSQQSATSPQQFTFSLVLTPVIQSSSPKTGPNDATTRVTIFGTGFQFPMQVFLTGGTCGAQLVEAAVSDISLNTIVFKTPVAMGANVCLSSQLVDIVIKNPSTGKGTSCPACFKYYACPTITSIFPAEGSYLGGTTVVITGHNFEEPAVVGGGTTAWSTVSVSSQEIIAVTPPLLVSGCADVPGTVLVTSTSLSCTPATTPPPPSFKYLVSSLSPFITRISPSSVPEAGAVGVVITGGNFIDPNMRVVVTTPNPTVAVFPTTRTPTQITFDAPPFTGNFLTVPCTVGTTVGVRSVDTPVEIDVKNVTTTCFAKDQLIYIPNDKTCRVAPTPPVPLAITTTSPLPDGATGTLYTFTLAATGGTTPYTWAASVGLPTGLNLNASTGVISGTPTVASTFNFSVTVTDSLGATATKNLSIKVNSSVPLSIVTTSPLPDAKSGTIYTFTLSATGGTTPYTWTRLGALPDGLTLDGSTGLISGKPTLASTFNFSVTVADSASHTATANLSIKVN